MLSSRARSAAAVLLIFLASDGCLAQQPPSLASTQAAGQPAANTAGTTLEQARAAFDRGDSATAAPLFLAALARQPSSFEANESLGLIYAEQGAYSKALPYLEAASRLQPRQAVAHANLGAALLQLGKTREAEAELQHACALDPSDAKSAANLGRVRLTEGHPAAAAQSFAAAARSSPGNNDLLHDWALALLDAGQPAEAAAVLAKIPAAATTDEVESLYGDVEEKLGHYQQAAAHMEHAAHLQPSEPNLHALAVELLRHWSWQQAAEVARFGSEKYPASERLSMDLGIALYGGGKYTEAASRFGLLLAASPTSALYADLLGRSCESLDESSSASCDQLQSFADAHPGNAQVDIYAARSILHRSAEHQEPARARAYLQAALGADPRSADALYELGSLEQQERNWAQSATLLEKAVALRPSYAEAHYRLARAYYRLGDKTRGDQQMAERTRWEQEEKAELDRKLKAVTIFLFDEPPASKKP